MEMKWFVVIDLPYEGCAVTMFDEEHETEARKYYKEGLEGLKEGYAQGVALIYGQILGHGTLTRKYISSEESDKRIAEGKRLKK